MENRLTKRELEVLELLCRHYTKDELVDLLFISKRTVDYHCAQIYEKLRVTNRNSACRRAIEMGLVDLTPTRQEEAEDLEATG